MDIYKPRLDRIGIAVSVLCVIHCVLLPLVISTLPLWGIEVLENFWIELMTIAVSFVFGGWAVWKGYQKHHRKSFIPLIFITGLILLIAANLIHVEKAEMMLKFGGAITITVAHILNWQHSDQCAGCESKC